MSASPTNRAFVIDGADGIAGIIVRDDQGYRFFSSAPVYDPLEGRVFRDAPAAQFAVRRLEAAHRRPSRRAA